MVRYSVIEISCGLMRNNPSFSPLFELNVVYVVLNVRVMVNLSAIFRVIKRREKIISWNCSIDDEYESESGTYTYKTDWINP